jgi:hypothetical protein
MTVKSVGSVRARGGIRRELTSRVETEPGLRDGYEQLLSRQLLCNRLLRLYFHPEENTLSESGENAGKGNREIQQPPIRLSDSALSKIW